MRLATMVMLRGSLWILLVAFLAGTVEPAVARPGSVQAQQFKKKRTAPTAKPAVTAKKKRKKAPPKRTRTAKKKPRAKVDEPRRPMP